MPHPISIYISGCTFHKWWSEWARHKIHGWECADGSLGMMGMMSAPMSWLGWLLAQNQRKIWCCAVYVILVQASYPSPNLPYPSESDMASCFYMWYVSEWVNLDLICLRKGLKRFCQIVSLSRGFLCHFLVVAYHHHHHHLFDFSMLRFIMLWSKRRIQIFIFLWLWLVICC